MDNNNELTYGGNGTKYINITHSSPREIKKKKLLGSLFRVKALFKNNLKEALRGTELSASAHLAVPSPSGHP